MRTARIGYVASKYMSFQRVACDYRDIIRKKYEIVRSLNDANIVVFHGPPSGYEQIYRRYPILRKKYVIGYYVWEADDLPDVYKKPVSLVQEVWTCSRYCCKIFEKYHPCVIRIPHVIDRDLNCSETDLAFVKHALGFEPDAMYFLSITNMSDKRKNTEALLKAFRNLEHSMPKARLIVKTQVLPEKLSVSDKRILVLPLDLPDRTINALYTICDVYISTHHSEGWGLTLSDAILFRKPVLATGYSGNLDFMNSRTSFLLDFRESFIRSRDCFNLFHTGMKWAYPDESDLEQKLLFLYHNRDSQLFCEMVQHAGDEIANFGRSPIGETLLCRIREIIEHEL